MDRILARAIAVTIRPDDLDSAEMSPRSPLRLEPWRAASSAYSFGGFLFCIWVLVYCGVFFIISFLYILFFLYLVSMYFCLFIYLSISKSYPRP